MSVTRDIDTDFEDFYSGIDSDATWKDHEPRFEWTEEDLQEFEWEELCRQQEMEAMAGWWDMEGVRCATFGRNPNRNPYR